MLALGCQLLLDDAAYGCGHVATLGHLLLHLGSRESEVIEDHQRLTSETGDDGIGHIVNRLTRLRGFQLCELQVLAELVERQTEVLGLYGSLHQLHIVHGTMGGLAQFVEDVGAVQTLEGMGDTVGALCHLDTFIHHLLDFSDSIGCSLAYQLA